MKKRLGILLTVAIALVTALALYARPGSETPPVVWMPSSIDETLTAGETTEIPVSFTTSKDLTDVVVRVVPEMAEFVSVTPSSLGNVPAGSTVQLVVTIAPAATSEPQALDGTIQLQQGTPAGRRYARPLPLTVKVVWPTTGGAAGFSVAYPPEFFAEEVVVGSERKVLFYRNEQVVADDNAPLLIHINSLRGYSTVRDYLLAQAIANEDIDEVLVGGRVFLRATRSLEENEQIVGYSALYDADQVITVTAFDAQFAQTPEFQVILESLRF